MVSTRECVGSFRGTRFCLRGRAETAKAIASKQGSWVLQQPKEGSETLVLHLYVRIVLGFTQNCILTTCPQALLVLLDLMVILYTFPSVSGWLLEVSSLAAIFSRTTGLHIYTLRHTIR